MGTNLTKSYDKTLNIWEKNVPTLVPQPVKK
jgi:hypothetical protein